MLLTDQLYLQVFYICSWSGGWVGWGGVEKLRLKLTLAKVEVEAELGNKMMKSKRE